VLLVCRAPRLVLCLTLLALAGSIYLACTRLEYHTQRNDLISPDKEVQKRWNRYLKEFGQDDDMVVVVQGDGPASHPQMIAALEGLAERIRTRPDLFDRLFYKVDLRYLRDRALLFLSVEEIRHIQEDLGRMRPLLEAPLAWHLFGVRSMVGETNARLKHLHPGQALSANDIPLLEQLLAATRSARAALADPKAYHSPWSGIVKPPANQPSGVSPQDLLARPQYFMSDDGKLAFLLVRPACKADAFSGPNESVNALRQLVEELRPTCSSLQLGVTGLPVLENDEMSASRNDTRFASWLALAGVIMVYLVLFRGLRPPLVSVSTLLVGTGWALGWATLTVGHLNLLSATFAIMLIGMGDYGILWVTRYKQERAEGLDVRQSLVATAMGIGPSTLTASVTTGLAFFAAMLADFMAVAELGWIAGWGVLFCALSCFTFLPALVMIMDGRKEQACQRHTLSFVEKKEALVDARGWLPRLASRPRWVLGGGLAFVALLALCGLRVHYDHNLLNLQSESLDSVRWERTLIRHTAGASWHALSYTDSHDEALALKARFEKLPTVSRVVEVASLVPADQDRKLPLLRDIHARLEQMPPRNACPTPFVSSPSFLVSELRSLAGPQGILTTRPLSPSNRTLVEALIAESNKLADQVESMPPALAEERLAIFERRMLADLWEDLHQLQDVTRAAPIALEDMPQDLHERYVSKGGRWLLRVFGRESLWEFDALSRFTASVQTIDPEATGKPFTTLEGLQAMKLGFEWAGVYALIAIVIVLALDFRSPMPVLLVLGPLLLGTVVALGVMGLFGCHLNPANMIALPLIVGAGVNYGVHVMHDYLLRRRQGKVYVLRRSTGLGILVVGLTTLVGFGSLMTSSHRGLAGLGLILSLGVAGSMLMALVFLPIGLKLWSERGAKQEVKREEVAEAIAA
jgi:hopanoid biosynthesis associated RND transporter like protein HpnN